MERKYLTNIKNDKLILNYTKRHIWPKFCFYYTNIDHFMSYYLSKESISRALCINNKGSIPLFFRPQNSFFGDIEGFRPQSKYKYGKYKCPFPICLLFNKKKILSLSNALITENSLISKRKKLIKVNNDTLAKLPYDVIYNDSRPKDWYKKKINYENKKRSGVILKSNKLPLKFLSCIAVRSSAESDTLKQVLTDNGLEFFINKIVVDQNCCIFFDKWTYIKSANLSSKFVDLFINVGQSARPTSWGNSVKPINNNHSNFIEIKISIVDPLGEILYSTKGPHLIQSHIHIRLKDIKAYQIKVYFDDDLAYYNRYRSKVTSNEILR